MLIELTHEDLALLRGALDREAEKVRQEGLGLPLHSRERHAALKLSGRYTDRANQLGKEEGRTA